MNATNETLRKQIKCSKCGQKAVVLESNHSGMCDRCLANTPFDGYERGSYADVGK